MSAPIENPIRVVVQNFADAPAPNPLVKTTTLRTYILDPAVTQYQQYAISNYEPKRLRMTLIVADAPCLLTSDAPTSPAPASVAGGPAPQGAYLPVTPVPLEIFGPDAFWLTAITGATAGRVTVMKEYC